METERRHQPRKQPEKLTYVHFEPENGGIVLNASEGGISFFAIAPLHQTGTIRFAIVPGTQERIMAAGQIVWTDELKKVGGLSFAELAPDVRERVRGWLSQRAAPPNPQANTGPLNPDELTGMDRQEQQARDAMGLLASFAHNIPPPDSRIPAARASSVYAFPTSLFPPESATAIHAWRRHGNSHFYLRFDDLRVSPEFSPRNRRLADSARKETSAGKSAAASIAGRGARAARKPGSGRSLCRQRVEYGDIF